MISEKIRKGFQNLRPETSVSWREFCSDSNAGEAILVSAFSLRPETVVIR